MAKQTFVKPVPLDIAEKVMPGNHITKDIAEKIMPGDHITKDIGIADKLADAAEKAVSVRPEPPLKK
ncbi:MAG: hypothetical protein FWD39_02495 [Clostridiales bacterium]|nr:hypothetical protein [Clostridiales bacterium]